MIEKFRIFGFPLEEEEVHSVHSVIRDKFHLLKDAVLLLFDQFSNLCFLLPSHILFQLHQAGVAQLLFIGVQILKF